MDSYGCMIRQPGLGYLPQLSEPKPPKPTGSGKPPHASRPRLKLPGCAASWKPYGGASPSNAKESHEPVPGQGELDLEADHRRPRFSSATPTQGARRYSNFPSWSAVE